MYIKLPKENEDHASVDGVGNVYVEYESVDEAKYARDSMYGKAYSKYHDILVKFVDPDTYLNHIKC